MDIPTALDQLRYTESIRNEGILAPATTLALAVSRLGSGPENNELIVAGTLAELAQLSPDAFGQPLHSLVIVGPRVHPLEIEFAAQFAVNPDSWRNLARIVPFIVKTRGFSLFITQEELERRSKAAGASMKEYADRMVDEARY